MDQAQNSRFLAKKDQAFITMDAILSGKDDAQWKKEVRNKKKEDTIQTGTYHCVSFNHTLYVANKLM